MGLLSRVRRSGRTGRRLRGATGIAFGLFCLVLDARAADVDEVRQKGQIIKKMLDGEEMRRQPARHKVAVRASLVSGYETNATLDPVRKGDLFQGVSVSALTHRPLSRVSRFSLRYDILSTTYHEVTDNSYLINNLDGRWVRKLFFGHVGFGTNLAYVYYPHNAPGDFFFPRATLFLRHNISRRVYHQWDIETSWRRYKKAKAVSDTLGSFEEKGRRDRQWGASYQIGAALNDHLSLSLRAKFLTNDSNARYQDYYDNRSYRGDLNLAYQLTSKDTLTSGLSFVRKDYASRMTVDGAERQSGDLWGGTFGLRHAFTQRSTLSFSYRFLKNLSNEPTAEYKDHIMTLGWSYIF